MCAGCAQCTPAARPAHQPTSINPPTHLRVVQDGWDGDGRHRAEAHQELARVLPAAGQVAAAGAAAEEEVGLVGGAGWRAGARMCGQVADEAAALAELSTQQSDTSGAAVQRCSPPALTMGTSTYTKAVSMGHQLCQSAHPRNCSSRPRKNAAPSPASLQNARGRQPGWLAGRQRSGAQQPTGAVATPAQPQQETHSRTSLGMAALVSAGCLAPRPARKRWFQRAVREGGGGRRQRSGEPAAALLPTSDESAPVGQHAG